MMRRRYLPRSFLYVPAVRPEWFGNASTRAADGVILDLEDAVPAAQKATGRAHVRSWLTDPDAPGDVEHWVRINHDSVAEDLQAVTYAGLDGVFVAKSSVEVLQVVSGELDALERHRGLESGSVGVIGLVETADALVHLAEMAASPRLTTFGIGEADLLAELRLAEEPRSSPALDMVRSQVVVHCAAAGLEAPVAPTSTAFRELDSFRSTTQHMADLGFRSRTAIHPCQVEVIHQVFTPDDAAVRAAREVVERFEQAEGGVTTGLDGRLIDAAVVRRAHETLRRGER
jgi:citrate lyase subunit beta/citryl-CoA lyase